MTRPSFTSSICCATSPSIIPTAPTVCPLPRPHIIQSVCHTDMSISCTTHQSVCLSTRKSVTLSIHTMASPSIIPIGTSYKQSIHPPVILSMTCQSATPPISPAIRPSDRPSPSNYLYTILSCPSGCPTLSDHTSTIYTSWSDCLSPPDCRYDLQPSPSDHLSPSHRLYDAPICPSPCPSPSDSLTATTSHTPICLSSHTIHRTQDSSQSLAVVNGEQSHKAKTFRRAFTNCDILLHALNASSIYLRDSRCVAPPKSGEDAHVTCGRCDFGGTTLNKPILGLASCYHDYGTLEEFDHHLMSLEIDLEH